ncbi:MAG TPA: transglutaminase domain-containing protein [Thermotogota bacterium]|nr:transglutaminase domain-containing protein [Thermotogota bacterium]HRW34124.1 transglutaminase domain-containing protein [Thermotogota bacterium]
MNYYTSVNYFTEITTQKWILNHLKLDYDFLFSVIKSIVIHPIEAKQEKVKYDRKKNGMFHCQNSTVETILKYGKLEKAFHEKRLPLMTTASDRAVLSCDHHALLFAAFVRYLNIPIRVRTGYSLYIVEGLAVPHWITERYDCENDRWIIMDPERKTKNVNKSGFLFAAQAWKDHIENGRDFPSYSGFSGKQGLKYALLCDLNCLFKNELLSYEWRLKEFNRKKPEIARTSYERLNDFQKNTFDKVTTLMLNPDKHMAELWQSYQKIVEPIDIERSGYGKYFSIQ